MREYTASSRSIDGPLYCMDPLEFGLIAVCVCVAPPCAGAGRDAGPAHIDLTATPHGEGARRGRPPPSPEAIDLTSPSAFDLAVDLATISPP
eukprot:1094955-Prorocentrum_minimum.AAC.1